ncbi:MAG: FAD-dependent oxidoreductase, partial [Actinomycetota bacterium]
MVGSLVRGCRRIERRMGVACIGIGLFSAVVAAAPGASAAGDGETAIPATLHYYQPVRERVAPEKLSVDLCVYGGTSAGVVAAVQAARDGRTVVLVAPET